jgi:acyl-CoA synthetase (AMP-forming)/AMP-acid ligase II
LLDVIEQRASSEKTWLVLPDDPIRSDAARRVTFQELCAQAREVANALRGSAGAARDLVGLIFDNGAEFCAAFFGVLLSGRVPVPLHPPYFSVGAQAYRQSILPVLDESRPALVLVDDRFESVTGLLADDARECITLSALLARGSASVIGDLPRPDPSEIALVQYSSGSTRRPLGAELTHSNLLWNVEGIGRAVDARPATVALCWLPLFHDMGLTGTLLYSFYWGMSLVLMSPRDFVVRPASWLWAMSRFGCRGCAAPNFAFAVCASRRKVPDELVRGLDLSPWRVAFAGGEAVQPATVDAFADRYAFAGFKREALCPAYGLAENTVACCLPEHGKGPRIDRVDRALLEREQMATPARGDSVRVREIVSVGKPLVGQRIRVVDEGERPVGERQVGNVQVAGASVMKGYRGRPEQTRAALTSDGWLRTGDLGYLADGELFIVGREKELIKKAGARYDAADMQAALGAVPGVRRGGATVFGVEDVVSGTERIVAAVETRLTAKSELRDLRLALFAEVRRAFGTNLDDLLLVQPQTLPKSTSGKIRGAECKRMYLEGKLALREAEERTHGGTE